MNINDAATILSLSGCITPNDVKKAYQKAAMRYHPDKNPAGLEMMKMVNAARDVLKDYTGDLGSPETTSRDASKSYPVEVNEALNAIIDLVGLNIEICGAWVWVDGDTYTHKAALKEANFRFAGKKKRWYFRPENWSSSSRGTFSMEEIREQFGSDRPAKKSRLALES